MISRKCRDIVETWQRRIERHYEEVAKKTKEIKKIQEEFSSFRRARIYMDGGVSCILEMIRWAQVSNLEWIVRQRASYSPRNREEKEFLMWFGVWKEEPMFCDVDENEYCPQLLEDDPDDPQQCRQSPLVFQERPVLWFDIESDEIPEKMTLYWKGLNRTPTLPIPPRSPESRKREPEPILGCVQSGKKENRIKWTTLDGTFTFWEEVPE